MPILEFILNNKDYLEDLITRSTYHSNAIEGSTLTYAKSYAILYNDNSFKMDGKEPREIYEAINHKSALELIFKNLKNNLPPVVISKETRVKYFEFLRNNDIDGLADWLRDYLILRKKE